MNRHNAFDRNNYIQIRTGKKISALHAFFYPILRAGGRDLWLRPKKMVEPIPNFQALILITSKWSQHYVEKTNLSETPSRFRNHYVQIQPLTQILFIKQTMQHYSANTSNRY